MHYFFPCATLPTSCLNILKFRWSDGLLFLCRTIIFTSHEAMWNATTYFVTPNILNNEGKASKFIFLIFKDCLGNFHHMLLREIWAKNSSWLFVVLTRHFKNQTSLILKQVCNCRVVDESRYHSKVIQLIYSKSWFLRMVWFIYLWSKLFRVKKNLSIADFFS